MDEDEIFLNFEEGVEKATEYAAHEFSAVNTGKANPHMVEGIMVEAYGSTMPIRDMAAISTPDNRTIAITPWDKGTLKAIEKAIQTSNIGINPSKLLVFSLVSISKTSICLASEFAREIFKFSKILFGTIESFTTKT